MCDVSEETKLDELFREREQLFNQEFLKIRQKHESATSVISVSNSNAPSNLVRQRQSTDLSQRNIPHGSGVMDSHVEDVPVVQPSSRGRSPYTREIQSSNIETPLEAETRASSIDRLILQVHEARIITSGKGEKKGKDAGKRSPESVVPGRKRKIASRLIMQAPTSVPPSAVVVEAVVNHTTINPLPPAPPGLLTIIPATTDPLTGQSVEEQYIYIPFSTLNHPVSATSAQPVIASDSFVRNFPESSARSRPSDLERSISPLSHLLTSTKNPVPSAVCFQTTTLQAGLRSPRKLSPKPSASDGMNGKTQKKPVSRLATILAKRETRPSDVPPPFLPPSNVKRDVVIRSEALLGNKKDPAAESVIARRRTLRQLPGREIVLT